MIRSNRGIVLAAIGALALAGASASAASGAPADTPQASEQAVGLQFRVVDTAGRPVAGARVRLLERASKEAIAAIWTDEGREFDARLLDIASKDGITTQPVESREASWGISDGDGWWRTRRALPGGRAYVAVVEADGCLAGLSRWSEPGDRGEIRLPDVVLSRLVSVEGRAIDGEGKPVAGVRVFQSGDGPERTEAVTDAGGQFRIGGVPEGGAFLFAEATGFRFQGQRIEAGRGAVEIVLERNDEPERRTLRSLPPAVPSLGHAEALAWAIDVYAKRLDRILAGDAEGGADFVYSELSKVRPGWILEHLDRLERVLKDEIGARDRMLMFAARQLSREDFDEAMALLRHVRQPYRQIQGSLFYIAGEKNRLPLEENLRAISEAALIARQLPDVTDRIAYLCWIAIFLADSRPDAAAALLTETQGYLDHASLTESYLKAYRGRLATAWAFLDQAKAWELMKSSRESEYLQIASALSRRDRPADCERFFSAYPFQESEQNTSLALTRLPNICYWLARSDPQRAGRMADRILEADSRPDLVAQLTRPARAGEGPESAELLNELDARLRKGLVYGLIAQGVLAADREAARRFAAEAVETVWPLRRGLSKYGYGTFSLGPANVLSMLLPVAERVDPAWGQELFWRALAARLAEPTGDGEQRWLHDQSLAALAVMLSRYDRETALQVLASVLEREWSRSFNGGSMATQRWVTDCHLRIDLDAAAAWVETLCHTPYENSRRSVRSDMRNVVATFYLGEDTRPDAAPEKRRRADLRLVRELAGIYVDDESLPY